MPLQQSIMLGSYFYTKAQLQALKAKGEKKNHTQHDDCGPGQDRLMSYRENDLHSCHLQTLRPAAEERVAIKTGNQYPAS